MLFRVKTKRSISNVLIMDLDPSALIYFADPDMKLKTRNRVEPFVTGTENCNKSSSPLSKKPGSRRFRLRNTVQVETEHIPDPAK